MPNIDQRPRDENGNEHGEWIAYFDSGNLRYRDNWFHGIPHGLWESFNHKGRLEYRGNYNMNKRIGYWFYDKQKKHYYLCII